MPLAVIGAGFGRTGTMSLKIALEQLGLGPCHHMVEVFEHPEQMEFFIRAANNAVVDWNELFAAYRSTTDWPACNFYKELAKFYPGAKVILTVRDPDSWFDSTQKTIFSFDSNPGGGPDEKMMRFFKTVTGRAGIGRQMHDRDHCIAMFKRHNEEVERTIPPERLLVFDVAEGWEPLCRFLGVPIPNTPFPRTNSREEFGHRIAEEMKGENRR